MSHSSPVDLNFALFLKRQTDYLKLHVCHLDRWEINHGKVHGERTRANYSGVLRKITIFNRLSFIQKVDRPVMNETLYTETVYCIDIIILYINYINYCVHYINYGTLITILY